MMFHTKNNSFRKKFIFIIKVILTLLLIYLLFKYGLIDIRSLKSIIKRIDLAFFALIFLFAGLLISGIRWWILLRVVGIQLKLKTVLYLQLIGSFFSTYLPGAAGGDVVRGYYIYRLLDSDRSKAFLSLLMDRAYSLIGLLSIAGGVYLFFPSIFTHNFVLGGYAKLMPILLKITLIFVDLVMMITLNPNRKNVTK